MTTIRDVAAEAGVSIATVSNYLNHRKKVKKTTEKKIADAISLLNYHPNSKAASLRSNTSSDIGIILPDFNDSFYIQIYQGIKSFFSDTKYNLNLRFTNDIPEYELSIAENFKTLNVCGLILITCQPNNWKYYYENYTKCGIPVVMMERQINDLDASFISFDYRSIVEEITDCILLEDQKNIAIITGDPKYSNQYDALKGFKDSLRAHSCDACSKYIINTDINKESGFRETIKLFSKYRPDVIISTASSLSTGIIEGLHVLGFSKEDIPVYSLGEEHWNLYTTQDYTATNIPRPAIRLGKTASRLLSEHIQSPLIKESERIILACQNISMAIRSSDKKKSERTYQLPPSGVSDLQLLLLDTPHVHSMLNLIPNFINKTGISVHTTVLPHNTLYNTIITMNEKQYDIIMYDIPWLRFLAASNVLLDITESFQSFETKRFFPNCFDYYSLFQNRYYGIPFMYAPQILYYRKDLFQDPDLMSTYQKENHISLRPPLTLKEYTNAADFFTSKTSAIPFGVSMPASYAECLVPELYMRIFSYGGKLFDKKGKVHFKSNETLKAYINFLRTIHASKPNYFNASDNDVVNDFLNGETAMLISYPSFLHDITDLRKNNIIGSIGYKMIPGGKSLLGGWGLGISAKSEKKEDAMKFLRWLCDRRIATYSTLFSCNTTITSTYKNDELNNLYPWLPLYHSVYQNSQPVVSPILKNGKVISQKEIDDVIYLNACKLLNEKLSLEETIECTHKDLNDLSEKYLSMAETT